MSLNDWTIYYVGDWIFWIWVLFLGGAEKIGDTFISGIFTFLVTLKWRELSPEGINYLAG